MLVHSLHTSITMILPVVILLPLMSSMMVCQRRVPNSLMRKTVVRMSAFMREVLPIGLPNMVPRTLNWIIQRPTGNLLITGVLRIILIGLSIVSLT